MNAKLTFVHFLESWENDILPNEESYIRRGQSLMNYLAKIWFEEYQRLSSIHYYNETNIDCFYRDDLIPNTLKHLERIWIN